METRGPNSKRNLDVHQQKLSLEIANRIISRYHATLVRNELDLIESEDDEWYSLDIYVSGVSIEAVIEMNKELADQMAELSMTTCEKKLLFMSKLVSHR